MFSYAEFHLRPAQRRAAEAHGLRAYLGVPDGVDVYLDNGAFYFLSHDGETPRADYEAFVARARPDWWPIPQDFIPAPMMTPAEQRACFDRTMAVNQAYGLDGYTPVIHISRLLSEYTVAILAHDRLAAKPQIALGGIVPNLLRASKAIPYAEILDSLKHVRRVFAGKRIHVFGLGGTATLHLAALLGMDSADSSGWRNRAARGIVQLPGSGDRMVANMGSWRGREPSPAEWAWLAACPCPGCQKGGLVGLKASRLEGFCQRATHNLWVVLEEQRWLAEHLAGGTYAEEYLRRLDNSIYLPLIRRLVDERASRPEAR
jgi:hypothetical protein